MYFFVPRLVIFGTEVGVCAAAMWFVGRLTIGRILVVVSMSVGLDILGNAFAARYPYDFAIFLAHVGIVGLALLIIITLDPRERANLMFHTGMPATAMRVLMVALLLCSVVTIARIATTKSWSFAYLGGPGVLFTKADLEQSLRKGFEELDGTVGSVVCADPSAMRDGGSVLCSITIPGRGVVYDRVTLHRGPSGPYWTNSGAV
jgi:hypothetical protein